MTTARAQLINNENVGIYHCVQRCVRRAWLCGVDDYTGQSYEHRKAWVEKQIALIGSCFAVAIHAYAVMSNHLKRKIIISRASENGYYLMAFDTARTS
jgi:hypothetical protein